MAVGGPRIELPAKPMGGNRLGDAKKRMNRARLVRRQRRLHTVGVGRARRKWAVTNSDRRSSEWRGPYETADGRPTSPSGSGGPSAEPLRPGPRVNRWRGRRRSRNAGMYRARRPRSHPDNPTTFPRPWEPYCVDPCEVAERSTPATAGNSPARSAAVPDPTHGGPSGR